MSRGQNRGALVSLASGVRSVWWGVIAFISRPYFFMEVAPWVLPVVGGLFISTHIGRDFHGFWFSIGVCIVLLGTVPLGTVPLGIRAYYREHIQKGLDEQDARERVCLRIVSNLVPQLPLDGHGSREQRAKLRDRLLRETVTNLADSAYPAKLGYRVTFYELGQDGEQKIQLRPVARRGRSDPSGTHAQGDEILDGIKALLEGAIESTSKSGIAGRDYTSYAQAAVSRGDALYGVHVVDTDAGSFLSEADEANLIPIADVLAAFFGAADDGNRQLPGSIWSRGMYSVKRVLCQRGADGK